MPIFTKLLADETWDRIIQITGGVLALLGIVMIVIGAAGCAAKLSGG